MKTTFKAKDGKEFDSSEQAARHESKIDLAKYCFMKLVEHNFFSRVNIKPFFHNHEVKTLGHPSPADWIDKLCGYRIVSGRMGNASTYIRFKIRGIIKGKKDFRKLLIFKFQGDADAGEKWKYLMTLRVGALAFDGRLKERLDECIQQYNEKPVKIHQLIEIEKQEALDKLTYREAKLLGLLHLNHLFDDKPIHVVDKRYLVFFNVAYYPEGGISDLTDCVSDLEEAKKRLESKSDDWKECWGHVYDIIENRIVFYK